MDDSTRKIYDRAHNAIRTAAPCYELKVACEIRRKFRGVCNSSAVPTMFGMGKNYGVIRFGPLLRDGEVVKFKKRLRILRSE